MPPRTQRPPKGTPNVALSDLLRSLCAGPPGPMRVREIVDHFGHRAFGAVLFVFAVPNLLPLPPGSSTVLGAPLVLIAPQLVLGARRPWLPRMVADRTIERSTLDKAFAKLIPRLERIEKLLAPRLGILFGPVGDRVIGLICFLLALVLILPITGGNMLPGATIAVFALALTQRDGLLALFGYFLTAASVAVLYLFFGAVVLGVKQAIKLFGG